MTLEVWLMPLGVGLESGGVELESDGPVWQPTATTRANKTMKVVFIAATIPPMLDGARVGGRRPIISKPIFTLRI